MPRLDFFLIHKDFQDNTKSEGSFLKLVNEKGKIGLSSKFRKK